MLSRNWRLLSRCTTLPALERWFSENKASTKHPIKLSPSAQEALWASKIIDIIKNVKGPSTIYTPSLKDFLIRCSKTKTKTLVFNDEVTQQFFNMFTNGVYVNQIAFNQASIKDQTQSEVETQQINKAQLKIFDQVKKQKKQPFVFFPNVLMTKAMFKYLYSNRYHYLICGGFGTSKTVSIMLYCYLTSKIHKFLYEASDKSSAVQQKIEAKHLQIHPQDYPRMWYWTIDWDQVTNPEFRLQKIILSQAPQLPTQTVKRLQKIQSFREFLGALKREFDNNLRHKIVIDNIDIVASKMRIWNNKVDQFNLKVKKLQDQIQILQSNIKSLQLAIKYNESKVSDKAQKQRMEIEKRQKLRSKQKKVSQKQQQELKFKRSLQTEYKQIEKVISYIQQLIIFGAPQTYILNSSMNMQSEIIDKRHISASTPNKLNLKRDGLHGQLQRVFIQFQSVLHEDWARFDFYHYFWFEVQSNLRNKLFPEQLIKSVKGHFLDLHKDAKPQNYSRFLWIRQYLNANHASTLNNIKKDSSLTLIKQGLSKIKPEFDEFCKDECIRKARQFLEKENESNEDKCLKKVIFDVIYSFAIEYRQNNKKKMEFKAKDLNALIPAANGNIYNILLTKDHNNELLPLRFDSNKQIVCFDWSVDEFIEIAESIVEYELRSVYSDLQSQENKQVWKNNRATLGIYTQFRLLQALQKQVVACIYYPKYFSRGKTQEKDYLKYKIKERIGFKTFNKNYYTKQTKQTNLTIQENMKDVFAAAKHYPDQQFLAIPMHNNKLVTNNRAIDFAIVKYVRKFESIQIDSFDVAVGDDINDKENKAIQFWGQMISKSSKGQEYRITHTFLSKQQFCNVEVKKINQHKDQANKVTTLPFFYNLKRSSLKHLVFENTKDVELAAISFRIIQQFIERLDDKSQVNK